MMLSGLRSRPSVARYRNRRVPVVRGGHTLMVWYLNMCAGYQCGDSLPHCQCSGTPVTDAHVLRCSQKTMAITLPTGHVVISRGSHVRSHAQQRVRGAVVPCRCSSPVQHDPQSVEVHA